MTGPVEPEVAVLAWDAWEDDHDQRERERELRRHWEREDPALVVEAQEFAGGLGEAA